jgi:hypothetical protein
MLLFCLLFSSSPSVFAQSPFGVKCGEDTHIDATKRTAIDLAAVNFANALFSSNPSSAFDALSKDGQLAIPREKMASIGAALVTQLSPKNAVVQHSYDIALVGKASGPVVCGDDLSKPEKTVLLNLLDLPDQAAVLMAADSINNHLAISITLVPEQGAWKVQGFWVNVSTLAEEDSNQLWQMGRMQAAKGHDFNAALLLSASLQLANRGPDFKLGIVQYIQEDLSNLSVPVEIRGQPPFIWSKGVKDFKVLSYGPIAVGGKIYVNISHEVEPWTNDAQVIGRNKELIAYFKQRFPEYSEVFAGVVARANEKGTNRGYGTVDENSAH